MSVKLIVFGHEKGGTGKSTLSVHMCVGLLERGYRVSVIDLDAKQGTVSRFFQNRQSLIEKSGIAFSMPIIKSLFSDENDSKNLSLQKDWEQLKNAVEELVKVSDFIICDTAGSYGNFTRLSVGFADVLISPVNDSNIDIDMLVKVDGQKLLPGSYAETVWEGRRVRQQMNLPPIKWVVIRNRLSPLHSKNQEECSDALKKLASVVGFTIGPTLLDRVVYREGFRMGLTCFDMLKIYDTVPSTKLAAEKEVSDFVSYIISLC